MVRDRLLRVTEGISVNAAGYLRPCEGFGCISSDGRFVAFVSAADDLVPGDLNARADAFLRDRATGTTELVSIGSSGAQGDFHTNTANVSDDGRFVVFDSASSTFVGGDTNAALDVFVRDRALGVTERISISTTGAQADGDSYYSSISADGRFVAFQSAATNIVPGDTNAKLDIFVRDRQLGTTQRVSVSGNGQQGDADSTGPIISNDGSHVTFTSFATSFGASAWTPQAFSRDLVHGSTRLVSAAMDGSPANGWSGAGACSADGRYVCFGSTSTDLSVSVSPNGGEIYVRDLARERTWLVSTKTSGAFANGQSVWPRMSPDGRYVAFGTMATDFAPGDTNGTTDVILKDRFSAGFESLCDPGLSGVIPCPCNNAPASVGRGCDNSASTGGASLAASGIAYLAQDSLVFTTQHEKPGTLSLLLQGTALVPSGAQFGQGVRCAGGTLRRMFVKTALNGGITIPEPGTGDVPISVRSAQVGIPIQAGTPRYFLVYYRDAHVLGGCAATDTFNSTQTCSIEWWP